MSSRAKLLIRISAMLSRRVRRAVAEVRETGLFDPLWYSERFPDTVGTDPVLHYVCYGEAEGRSPNVLFDPAYYRRAADVPHGQTAVGHFASSGWKQGIAPHPLFDMTYYRERYPDVSGNPLVHFVQRGEAQGYDPHPLFLTSYYRAAVGEPVPRAVSHFLRAGNVSPYPVFDPGWYGGSLLEYLTEGAQEGRDPHPLFSIRFYKRLYRTMLQGMDPLVHYAKTGGVLPQQPHALFDPAFYASRNPDAARTGYPMLIAYLESAGNESPHPLFDPGFYRSQAGVLSEPPLLHYIRHGDRAGLWPNRMFDPRFYRSHNPGLHGITALEHYIEHCFDKGADPHPSFSTAAYMDRRPALAPGQTPLGHYLARTGPLPDIGATAAVSAGPGISELQREFDEAREGNRDLLVRTGDVQVDDDELEHLRTLLGLDPMFGCVTPRLLHDGGILSLDRSAHLPEEILRAAPEFYIVPETESPCWLFRRDVVRNAPPLDISFGTAAGALYHLLYRLRRIGYRCVVANRVVARARSVNVPPAADIHRLSTEHPDNLRARQEFASHPAHRHEALLAQRRTLLLDGRGIPAGFNGTSEFALGLLDGIEALPHEWNITLLVNPGVDEHHGLSARYPKMRVTAAVEGRFAVAVRLSQPWYADTLRQVHELALFNAHFVYDTITWDVVYPAPRHLTETWGLLAQHSDALIYLSEFTQRRFRMRFPDAAAASGLICYPSLDADDYAVASAGDEGYVLVAGNEYDHKGVAGSADVLQAAFPALEVRTMAHAVGRMPPAALDELYARASAVVFPSFYEGFGFPVVRGLAYGKTVFARKSELADELMDLYRGPGRLVTFESPEELIAAMHTFLKGGSQGREGQGSGNRGWRESARRLLDFIGSMAGDRASSRWLAREAVFRQMEAWKSK